MSLHELPILVVDGSYADWREQALRALAAGWPPERLTWTEQTRSAGAAPEQMTLDYIGPEASAALRAPSTTPPPEVRISKTLAALLRDAALYRASERWAFLYRVLWRWQHGDRAVASAADRDGARLHAMAKTVRRAKHDMIAYVRFHQRPGGDSPEYLAWYEPEHDVLAYAAEHFARRLGTATWCIGTPQGAALWNGQALQLTDTPADPEALRAGAATDQVEPLWLLYYQSIFNPARLNEAALTQSMPVRFWKHLPEGALIPAMIADARNGARRNGQADAVGRMPGKAVVMDAQSAMPTREAPSSLDQCRRCELWCHATQAVPGQGPDTARLMLIGEQPGDQEDLTGRPFVGPAGQLLDEALRRAEVPRDAVYLTNTVKHFKWMAQGKRRIHKTPSPQEIAACTPWLMQEIEQHRPAVLVTLGATALGAVLGRPARLQDHQDEPLRLGKHWLVATWHPAHALRNPNAQERERILADIVRALTQAQRLIAEVDATLGHAAPRHSAPGNKPLPAPTNRRDITML